MTIGHNGRMAIDRLRFHRLSAGNYSNVEGHRVWRLENDDPSRIPGMDWRLSHRADWMGDHPTLAAAQASIREENA